MLKRKQIYKVTDWGVDYIQSDDVHAMASQGITIVGVAEFMLGIFKFPVYEVDDIQYPALSLDTNTKIECLIQDGFIEEYRDK